MTQPDLVCVPKAGVEVKAGMPAQIINLEVTAGHLLTGRVLDERTHEPGRIGIANKPFNIQVQAWLTGDIPVLFTRAVTDDDGHYQLRLPPGEFKITTSFVRSGQRHEASKTISVGPDSTPYPVDLFLPFNITIETN